MPESPRPPRAVRVFEVGPRDGLQNHPVTFDAGQRLALIERLVAAGLRDIEIGSFVHPKWVPQMAGTDEVARGLPGAPGVRFWGLVPNVTGLERALDAGMRHVSVVMSASETHNEKNLNRDREQSLAAVGEVLGAAGTSGASTRAYLSTAFGCPYEGDVAAGEVLRLVRRLFDAGADEVVLSDTIGSAIPSQVTALCRSALALAGRAEIALHVHDTRGLGLANALAALAAGVRTLDGSIGGIGGCPYAPGASGNLATEDLVHALGREGHETGVDLDALVAATRWMRAELDVAPASRVFFWRDGARTS